jgi:hypothetical protein
VGFIGASGMLFLSSQLENPVLAMVSMGFGSFSNDLVMPGAWAACMDVGGKHAGRLSGTMNMTDNWGGSLSRRNRIRPAADRKLADSVLRLLHHLPYGCVLLDGAGPVNRSRRVNDPAPSLSAGRGLLLPESFTYA